MERNTQSNTFRKADAFLNIRVEDAEGNKHSLKGIPLYEDRRVDRGVIGMGQEKLNELLKSGKVELVVNSASSDEDITF